MANYPIIRIPSTIQKAIPSVWPALQRPKPDLPARPPVPIAPKAPEAKPQPINAKEIAIQTAALMFCCLLAALGLSAFLPPLVGLTIGFFTFLISAGTLAFVSWREQKSFSMRLKQFKIELQKYERKRDKYHQQKADYPKHLEAFKHKQHQYKIALEVWNREKEECDAKLVAERSRLRKVFHEVSADGNNSHAPCGQLESKFEFFLNKYFSGKIYTGLTLNIPNFPHPYTADFTYLDKELNLHIDIEIDEPYVYKTGKPQHFLGCHKDEQRNEFFLERRWIVIRFAEEQIARWPDSCCKIVAKQVNKITGNLIHPQLANIPDLQVVRQWTEAEAKRMAARKERDIYLP